ncbi:MAG: PaaI family thioesterase [Pseudomonadota bacterium]
MADRTDLVRAFITELPFSRALGLELEDLGAGWAVLALPWAEALVGDPESGVIHGGAVSALIDTACGAAALSHPKAGVSSATLDLRIDYMRPAAAGARLLARADCHHITRSVAFVRAVAHDGDAERPVVHAAGAFTVDTP